MYKILLITTKGCGACDIMSRLVKEAIVSSKKSIQYVEKDYKDIPKKYLALNEITDFPTTLFIKDNEVKFKYTGTNPKIVILRWIDVYFK